MIREGNIPGLGLKWPASWQASVAFHGSSRAAGRAVGIGMETARRYTKGIYEPLAASVRKKFKAHGWSDTELPPMADYRRAHRATVEAKARFALFQMIWRRNPHMNSTDRFVHAIVESAKPPVIDHAALTEWMAGREKKRPGDEGISDEPSGISG